MIEVHIDIQSFFNLLHQLHTFRHALKCGGHLGFIVTVFRKDGFHPLLQV